MHFTQPTCVSSASIFWATVCSIPQPGRVTYKQQLHMAPTTFHTLIQCLLHSQLAYQALAFSEPQSVVYHSRAVFVTGKYSDTRQQTQEESVSWGVFNNNMPALVMIRAHVTLNSLSSRKYFLLFFKVQHLQGRMKRLRDWAVISIPLKVVLCRWN